MMAETNADGSEVDDGDDVDELKLIISELRGEVKELESDISDNEYKIGKLEERTDELSRREDDLISSGVFAVLQFLRDDVLGMHEMLEDLNPGRMALLELDLIEIMTAEIRREDNKWERERQEKIRLTRVGRRRMPG